jgi:hypothetical protein
MDACLVIHMPDQDHGPARGEGLWAGVTGGPRAEGVALAHE